MKTTQAERQRAESLSAAIDELIRDPEARLNADASQAADAALLSAARRLTVAVRGMEPPDAALTQRVRVAALAGESRRPAPTRRLRPLWAAAALVIVLLLATLLTPAGQTALASFMSVFKLGRTEVHITPAGLDNATATATATPESPAIRQDMTLAEARSKVRFAVPEPGYVVDGYRLDRVSAYTYPDLPAWIQQPFFVELAYKDGQGHSIWLRVYPITLGDRATISHLNLEAVPIKDVQDVDVNGKPGVLLRLGSQAGQVTWQEVVWEHDDLVVSLSADQLGQAELLKMARSVH